jgi:hypothetical protein
MDLEPDRDLLRRKSTRLTSDPLGLHRSAAGLGGNGHAPPFLPHDDGLTFAATFLDLLRLTWPMHDTLGDDGSGVRYPDADGCLLLPRASGGTMEMMGPENALRWLKDDRPREEGKVEEKEATVDRRNEAIPPPVKLLDRPFCFGFSIKRLIKKHVRRCQALARFFSPDDERTRTLSLGRVLRLDLSLLLVLVAVDPGNDGWSIIIYTRVGHGRFGA